MYKPEFSGPIEGYVVNFLKSNLWRVANSYDLDECLSEAYLVFRRCCRHYEGKVVEPKHFMALFKLAWRNEFNDMSNRDTAVRASPLPDGFDAVGALDNDGPLRVMLRQAPAEVKTVLTVLLNAPTELLDLACSNWRGQGKQLAGGNKQVATWLGWPEDSKPIDMVVEYFTK